MSIWPPEKYPDLRVRISIEGRPKVNDELRGISHGFEKGLRTLLELKDMGMQDIGFGITLSDRNARDLLSLYRLAKVMGLEFATAATHNSYYFHKFDNAFAHPKMLCRELDRLIADMLKSGRPKNWFRAYCNYGLQNFIRGGKRLLPCEAGTDIFFVDPLGEVRPCNAMDESMGNIREVPFAAICHRDRAQAVRDKVRTCQQNCGMSGTVAPAMKQRLWIPLKWVVERKLGLRSREAAGETA